MRSKWTRLNPGLQGFPVPASRHFLKFWSPVNPGIDEVLDAVTAPSSRACYAVDRHYAACNSFPAWFKAR